MKIYYVVARYLSEHPSWFESCTAPTICCEFNIAATLQQGDIISGSPSTYCSSWEHEDYMAFVHCLDYMLFI